LAFGVIALGIITAIQLILLEFIGFQRTLGKSLQQKSVRLPSEWLKQYSKDHGKRSARRYVRLKSTLRARRTHISDLPVANRGKVRVFGPRGTQILGDVSDHLGNLRLRLKRHVIGGVEERKSLQKSHHHHHHHHHHHFSSHDRYCSDKPVSESKEFKFSSSGQRQSKSMAFVAASSRATGGVAV
jgi:G3E family GTPase